MGPEEMGRQLRRARQHRGLSLRDVHAITAIPLPCLAALEEGNLAQLPSPVYARGYVRSYAEAMRLDGDTLALDLWRAEKAPPFVPKERRQLRMPSLPRFGRPKAGKLNLKRHHNRTRRSGRFSKLAPALERTAIAVLAIVLALGVWGLVRGDTPRDTKTATKASEAKPLAAAAQPSSPTSSTPTTLPAPPAPPTPTTDNGSVATYALGRDRFTMTVAATGAPLWIQVRAGQRGPQLFMGTLQAGQTMPLDVTGVAWVRLGNLAHAVVNVDGTPLTLPSKPAVPYNLLLQK